MGSGLGARGREMKRWLILGLVLCVMGLGGWWAWSGQSGEIKNPLASPMPTEKPYDKYSFERLVTREDKPSQIEIGKALVEQPEYSSYVFYYNSEGRRISGQLNLPNLSQLMGVIVMARGYVEKDGYTTGTGTRNAAAVYARNGYITIAPDFSGYAESDPGDSNALGARLVKPVEILDLIASLSSLPQADLSKVYLWGHSNGGQIMLSVAEVLGKRSKQYTVDSGQVKGVVLWAPVSKPFPYNILFYTDEADPPSPTASEGRGDQGKALRKLLAEFENDYDVFKYSIDEYWDWIQMPLLIHQGTVDDAVPVEWSRELDKKLAELEKEYTYYEYPGADHNLRPDWNTVVGRDVEWFGVLTN